MKFAKKSPQDGVGFTHAQPAIFDPVAPPEFGSEHMWAELAQIAVAVTSDNYDTAETEAVTDILREHDATVCGSRFLEHTNVGDQDTRWGRIAEWHFTDEPSPEDLAVLVGPGVDGDLPAELCLLAWRWLKKIQGVGLADWVPCDDPAEFVGVYGAIHIPKLIGDLVSAAADEGRAHKWLWERARPEEVLAAWVAGDIAAPAWFTELAAAEDVRRKIEEWGGDGTWATRYPSVGCPGHPAYPAWHSTLAATCVGLAVVSNADVADVAALARWTHVSGVARVVAGVHYWTDHTYGSAIGEAVAVEHFWRVSDGLPPVRRRQLLDRLDAVQTEWMDNSCH